MIWYLILLVMLALVVGTIYLTRVRRHRITLTTLDARMFKRGDRLAIDAGNGICLRGRVTRVLDSTTIELDAKDAS